MTSKGDAQGRLTSMMYFVIGAIMKVLVFLSVFYLHDRHFAPDIMQLDPST